MGPFCTLTFIQITKNCCVNCATAPEEKFCFLTMKVYSKGKVHISLSYTKAVYICGFQQNSSLGKYSDSFLQLTNN